MMNWIISNIEICALAISIFSVLMLIWSNYENIKSRRLQYLPYLRLETLIKSIKVKDYVYKENPQKIETDRLINEFYTSRESSNDSFRIHNDGVGIAKDLKIIFDCNEIISKLESHDDNMRIKGIKNDVFYLKPFFDVYEIKSFHHPIYESINMSNTLINDFRNKINTIISIIKNKLFKKEFATNLKTEKNLLYIKYLNKVIKSENRSGIDFGTLLNTFQLIYLMQSDEKLTKIRIPLYIEYRDLENRVHKEYYNLKWECLYSRFGISINKDILQEIVNGEINMSDVFESFEHNTENFCELKPINNSVGWIKFLKYRVKRII